MAKSRLKVIVLLLCLSTPAAHAAQEPPAAPQEPSPQPAPAAQPAVEAAPEPPLDAAPTLQLDEIVVTSSRTEARVRDVPASVSVVSRAEIEEAQVARVEELLLTLPGVDGAEPMAGGAPGAPRLRGLPGTFAGATTQVLVDGMPVEPVLIGNRQAWLLVAPRSVERVEVARGPVSALYGPSAAGGVINLITRSGQGEPFAELSTGYGSYATYGSSFTGGGTVAEGLDLLVGASDQRTTGHRAWPETPARWAPYYPAGLYDLEGRDSSHRTFQARLGARPSERHEVSLAYRYFEIDGAWLGGHPNYRWDRRGGTADLGYRFQASEALEVKARLLRAEYGNQVRFDGNAYMGDGDLDLIATDREWEKTWNADVQSDLRLLPGNVLTLGGSWQEGDLTYESLDDAGARTAAASGRSRVIAGYVQDQHHLGERVVLQVGGRYDRYRFFEDERDEVAYPGSKDAVLTYRAGVRVNPARATSLFVSAGSAYLPALNTLKYRRPGGTWLSNPELDPERSVSFELGATQELAGRASGTVALFRTRYTDKITVAQVGGQRQYQNLAVVEVTGLEASGEVTLAPGLGLAASYTLTDATIGDDPSAPDTEGKHPAYTPRHKASATVRYAHDRLGTAGLAARWVGEQFSADTNAADTRMDSYFTLDARVSRALPFGAARRIVVALSATNLLDARYVVWNDELAAGRSYWAELTLQF